MVDVLEGCFAVDDNSGYLPVLNVRLLAQENDITIIEGRHHGFAPAAQGEVSPDTFREISIPVYVLLCGDRSTASDCAYDGY